MPSVLVRVKKEMMERDEANPSEDENNDFSSDDENDPSTEQAFEATEEEEKSTEQGLKCGQCGAAFEDKDELTIHIGEVYKHMKEYH